MNASRIICKWLTWQGLFPLWTAAVMMIGATSSAFGTPKESDAFDPLGFPGDTIVVTDDVKPAGQRAADARSRDQTGTADSARIEIMLQVQFLATTNLTEAKDVKARAEAALKDSVRLEFETPYYKLRTGRFVEYDEAEALAVRLRRMGYESAWVVRVRKPALDDSRVE